jgi:hypothetical protein
MPDDPVDPCGDGVFHTDDECTAVGMAVIDTLNNGCDIVVVRRRGDDYWVDGLDSNDSTLIGEAG